MNPYLMNPYLMNPYLMNPYLILEINQTATKEEIREALKKQISLHCGDDESKKNAKGEYLKEMYVKAAKSLLNDESRKKVDKKLFTENENNNNKEEFKDSSDLFDTHVVSKDLGEDVSDKKITVKKQGYVITSINKLILSDNFKIKRNGLMDKMISLDHMYAVIGRDNSFMFVNESFRFLNYKSDDVLFRFVHAFSHQNIMGVGYEYEKDERPWNEGRIFEVDGVESIAIVAAKFIPDSAMSRGRITERNLKQISSIIGNYLIENPDFIQNIFNEDAKINQKK